MHARSLCDGPEFNTKSITLQNLITMCLQIQISVINAVGAAVTAATGKSNVLCGENP